MEYRAQKITPTLQLNPKLPGKKVIKSFNSDKDLVNNDIIEFSFHHISSSFLWQSQLHSVSKCKRVLGWAELGELSQPDCMT